mmetsp:Transcript_11968/g.17792  ORF Transcript_11968/g.17792 Transcript_11968/m.17792 type:complete len:344 (-) Transcript_11968:56-1087(-)
MAVQDQVVDPRWIVSDLGEKGRNVNGWHWEYKNALPWFKETAGKVFDGTLLYENNEASITFTSVEHVKGEAQVTNRKKRLGAMYEVDMKVGLEAILKGDDGSQIANEKGALHFPYIADENDLDEFDMNLKGIKNKTLRSLILKQGKKGVTERIVSILTDLKQGAGLLINYADQQAASNNQTNTTTNSTPKPKPTTTTTTTQPKAKSTSSKTDEFTLKSSFASPPGMLFDCFVNPGRIQVYTNSAAHVDPTMGGKFDMFNGNITGTFLEIEHNVKLVQSWRAKDWPKDVQSHVTMKFDQQGSQCVLTLTHKNVPAKDVERIRSGWQNNFFSRIKSVFGFGGVRF